MKVEICTGKACGSNFSEYIIKRIEGDKARLGLAHVEIEKGMCMGMCKKGPNVKVDGEVMNYSEPAKVSDRVVNGIKKPKKKKVKFNAQKK